MAPKKTQPPGPLRRSGRIRERDQKRAEAAAAAAQPEPSPSPPPQPKPSAKKKDSKKTDKKTTEKKAIKRATDKKTDNGADKKTTNKKSDKKTTNKKTIGKTKVTKANTSKKKTKTPQLAKKTGAKAVKGESMQEYVNRVVGRETERGRRAERLEQMRKRYPEHTIWTPEVSMSPPGNTSKGLLKKVAQDPPVNRRRKEKSADPNVHPPRAIRRTSTRLASVGSLKLPATVASVPGALPSAAELIAAMPNRPGTVAGKRADTAPPDGGSRNAVAAPK